MIDTDPQQEPLAVASGELHPRVPRRWLAGAASLRDLQTRLLMAAQAGDACWADPATPLELGWPWRVAVLAATPAELTDRLRRASAAPMQFSSVVSLERHGIMLRQFPVQRPRVVFAFPGQGTHYPGMLQSMTGNLPAAAAALAECDRLLCAQGRETFSSMTSHRDRWIDRDLEANQLSVLAASYIAARTLAAEGVLPDVVIGHSYGEFAALVAAGAWSMADAVHFSRLRREAIGDAASAGSMWAANSTPDALRPMLAAAGLHLAACNGRSQTVFAGAYEAADRVGCSLSRHGISAVKLPIPAAFHTPLLEPAAQRFRMLLQSAPLKPCRPPLLSSTTCRYIVDPADIRQSLGDQLTHTARYGEAVEKLAAQQPTVLIEVGAGQTLTRIHRRIFDKSADAWSIAVDAPGRCVFHQWACVRALLELVAAEGAAASASPHSLPMFFDATGTAEPAASRDLPLGPGCSTANDMLLSRQSVPVCRQDG